MRDLSASSLWLDSKLEQTLMPAIASAFPYGALKAPHLRVSGASIVKYNATAGQSALGIHRDGPLIAATIALNGADEYQGGGTLIEALSTDPMREGSGVLKVDVGHVILHPGALRHGGNAIRSGLRYIMVIWFFSVTFEMPEHYALRRANGYLAAALRAPTGGSFRAEVLAAAANAFDEAIRIGAGALTESAHVGLGQVLLEMGNPEEAEGSLREALMRAPGNAHAKALLERCLK